jgi:hypothetical protein
MIRTRRAALAQSVKRLSEKIMPKQEAKSAMSIRVKVVALWYPPGDRQE